jgi:sugar diacid utilization regulator
MSTKQKLISLSNKLSKAIGSNVYIFDNNNANNFDKIHKQQENEIASLYDLNINEQSFTIVVEEEQPLSSREVNLVKSFIEEFFESEEYIVSTTTEKTILTLINEELDRREVEETLLKLGFTTEKGIVVIHIKLYEKNSQDEVISVVNNITSNHIVHTMTDKDILTVVYQQNSEDSINLAKKIVDIVETELFEKIHIGMSTVRKPYEIKTAYKEALDALNIGIEHQLPSNIHLYKDLLIYRLVSYLPEDRLMKLYNESIESGFEKLNEDEIKTANVFIDCSFNISEAARKLYIHRNTLIYRLDKIQKDTGFDIRVFNNALKFKILLVIYKYMKNKVK